MTKAIVIGGSRGIGKAISDSLNEIGCDVIATSKKDLDTSNLDSVKNFVSNQKDVDILVLNTGGPPAKEFFQFQKKNGKNIIISYFWDFVLF